MARPKKAAPLMNKFGEAHEKIRRDIEEDVKFLAVNANKWDKDFHGEMRCPVCGNHRIGYCRAVNGEVSACCPKPGCVAFLG